MFLNSSISNIMPFPSHRGWRSSWLTSLRSQSYTLPTGVLHAINSIALLVSLYINLQSNSQLAYCSTPVTINSPNLLNSSQINNRATKSDRQSERLTSITLLLNTPRISSFRHNYSAVVPTNLSPQLSHSTNSSPKSHSSHSWQRRNGNFLEVRREQRNLDPVEFKMMTDSWLSCESLSRQQLRLCNVSTTSSLSIKPSFSTISIHFRQYQLKQKILPAYTLCHLTQSHHAFHKARQRNSPRCNSGFGFPISW